MQQDEMGQMIAMLAKHYALQGRNEVIARLVSDELARVSAFSPSVAAAAKDCTTVGQVLELLAKNAPQGNAQVLLQELVLAAAKAVSAAQS